MIQAVKPKVIGVARRPEPQGNPAPVSPSTPILYSDLTGKFPEEAELTEIIRSFNKKQTFFMLCAVNTLVSFFAHEFEDSIAVEKFLQGNFLEAELIKAIDQKLEGQSVLQHPLFHRQLLLALQRRVLLEATEEGGRDPNPEANHEDRHLLGKACLMMNNLLFPREQEERLQNSGAPGEDERIHGELFAQWLPTSEVLNPPDPVHSVVRHLEYARIFDERYAAYAFGEGRTLSQRFQELTGIELKKFLIFLFNFDLFYRSHTRDELIGNMTLFNVDIKTVFGKLKITEAEVQAFFNLLTSDVASLMTAFTNVPEAERATQPQFDVRPFRTAPLVYRNDERTIVTCADPAFLQEKISSGAYHTILRALEGEAEVRNDRDEADRKRFLKQYWGEVFEIYLNTRLRELYPLATNRFYASPKWDSPRAQRNNEAFDGFLDYGDTVIAMEYKGKYLSLTAKYSGDRELLLADLNERFGKAARQLAQRSETAFNRDLQQRHGFSQRDQNNQPVLTYTVDLSRQVRRVYPVVIVQDPAMRIGFANREMQKLFDAEIKTKQVDQALIKPLTLLTIEDLEYLIPYLGEVTLPEILDEYLKPHEPIISFRYIMNQYLHRRGFARRQNEWTMRRFDELRDSLKDLFVVFD
jgi:hypothetical protein